MESQRKKQRTWKKRVEKWVPESVLLLNVSTNDRSEFEFRCVLLHHFKSGRFLQE